MSKYDPLREYLRGRTTATMTLPFASIADVVPGGLPASAYRHGAWWANSTSHVQALAWLDAGWVTTSLSLTGRTVTFTRST